SDSKLVCQAICTFSLSCVTVKSRRRASVTASDVVVAVEESLLGTGSVSVRVAVAVFVMVPVAFACTMRSTYCVLPTGSEPSEQTTVVVPPHEPMLVLAEMKITLAGSGSLIVTFVAVAGPLFVTARRHVMYWPG